MPQKESFNSDPNGKLSKRLSFRETVSGHIATPTTTLVIAGERMSGCCRPQRRSRRSLTGLETRQAVALLPRAGSLQFAPGLTRQSASSIHTPQYLGHHFPLRKYANTGLQIKWEHVSNQMGKMFRKVKSRKQFSRWHSNPKKGLKKKRGGE